MAEPVGIVISAAGLPALANTVEKCFNKVSDWKEHGTNLEPYRFKLESAAEAYHRWRKSVEIVDDASAADATAVDVAQPKDIEMVKELLGAIATAFLDAEKKAAESESGAATRLQPLAGAGKTLEDFRAGHKALTAQREKGSGSRQEMSWGSYDEGILQTLTERVDEHVQKLVHLFPGVVAEIQTIHATMELENRIPTESEGEVQKLLDVIKATRKADPIMEQVAKDTIKRVEGRHRVQRNRVGKDAMATFGDAYGEGSTVQLTGAGHDFLDNEVTGNATAAFGDRVNMPDIFAQHGRHAAAEKVRNSGQS